jgi:hypothetical protein
MSSYIQKPSLATYPDAPITDKSSKPLPEQPINNIPYQVLPETRPPSNYITQVQKAMPSGKFQRLIPSTHSCCFPLILHRFVSVSARFSMPPLSSSFTVITQCCNNETQLYIRVLIVGMILELKTRSFLLSHRAQ